MNPVCTALLLPGLGPGPLSGQPTRGGFLKQTKTTTTRPHQQPSNANNCIASGDIAYPPPPSLDFHGWSFHRSCICCHTAEFIYASAPLCLRNTVSWRSFTTPNSYNLSAASLAKILEPWGEIWISSLGLSLYHPLFFACWPVEGLIVNWYLYPEEYLLWFGPGDNLTHGDCKSLQIILVILDFIYSCFPPEFIRLMGSCKHALVCLLRWNPNI